MKKILITVLFLILFFTFKYPEDTFARQVRFHGVDNVSDVNDFTILKEYGINLAQVIVQESGLTKLNSYIQKAEETDMYLIVWPNGPHFCGANCIPWNLVNGQWVIDESEKPILNRLVVWKNTEKGGRLLLGINTFQEPRNDGITIEQQVALTNKIKTEYGLPIANWIDNVVDTQVPNHDTWVSKGANAIDWPISWTHCIPYYKGSGGNTCQELTCEIANPTNTSCCASQWATSCSQKCYGPEGTCAYGLDKIRRDREIVGETGNYGVLLQAFENVGYNNAHVPVIGQMYEEACRIAKSGYVDAMIWYDWDRSYSGYTKTLHNGQIDPYGDDRWQMLKKISDECIFTSSPNPSGSFIPGDANGDQLVDTDDFKIWIANYAKLTNQITSGDFSLNGKVNLMDSGIWYKNRTN